MSTAQLLSMLTDYAIALEALICAIALAGYQQLSVRYWSGSFVAIAIAALSAGTFHGFLQILAQPLAWFLWKTTLYSLGVASTLALCGTALTVSHRLRYGLLGLAGCKAILYIYAVTRENSFTNAAIDYLLTLLIILAVLVGLAIARSIASGYWVAAGVAIAAIATGLLVQQDKIAQWHPEAVYHLIQMVAIYCLYRGVRLLKDG